MAEAYHLGVAFYMETSVVSYLTGRPSRDIVIDLGVVPSKSAVDAAHIAIAVVNGMDYFVSWYFRHIANVTSRAKTEQACRKAGYEPPVICTPNELMEATDES